MSVISVKFASALFLIPEIAEDVGMLVRAYSKGSLFTLESIDEKFFMRLKQAVPSTEPLDTLQNKAAIALTFLGKQVVPESQVLLLSMFPCRVSAFEALVP